MKFFKRKSQKIICYQCNNIFNKSISEIKRNANIGRENFCSRNCAVKYAHVVGYYKNAYNNSYKNLPKKIKDELSPFRKILGACSRRVNNCNLTLIDLKNQWNKQKGICPYTGMELLLITYSLKANIEDKLRQASLDRIDSTKGYIVGNIEFIAMPINYMKHDFPKEAMITFLKKVSKFYK